MTQPCPDRSAKAGAALLRHIDDIADDGAALLALAEWLAPLPGELKQRGMAVASAAGRARIAKRVSP